MTPFPRYVSSVKMAEILACSRAMVGKYVKQGMPKHARGKYDVVACANWLIEGLRDKRDGKSDSTDLALERLKLYQSQRIRTDLENAKMRGELLPSEDVAEAFNAMAAEVATKLDAIGGRLASQLAGLNKPAEVQAVLLAEMREIRAEIARGWDDIATDNDGVVDRSAAA